MTDPIEAACRSLWPIVAGSDTGAMYDAMARAIAAYEAARQDISCPFCGEGDFDRVGLKVHLAMLGWCVYTAEELKWPPTEGITRELAADDLYSVTGSAALEDPVIIDPNMDEDFAP